MQLRRQFREELGDFVRFGRSESRHQVQLQNAAFQFPDGCTKKNGDKKDRGNAKTTPIHPIYHTGRKRVLQFREQMPVQMRPNVPHDGQIVHVDRMRNVLDNLVHAKALVFVRLQLGVERLQRAGEAAKQHILPDQRVHVLNVRHDMNRRRAAGGSRNSNYYTLLTLWGGVVK